MPVLDTYKPGSYKWGGVKVSTVGGKKSEKPWPRTPRHTHLLKTARKPTFLYDNPHPVSAGTRQPHSKQLAPTWSTGKFSTGSVLRLLLSPSWQPQVLPNPVYRLPSPPSAFHTENRSQTIPFVLEKVQARW